MNASETAPPATGNFEFTALRLADNYRRALLREFSSFLQGEVVEIGAGIGQFSERVCGLSTVTSLTAVEPDAGFCAEFRKRLPHVRLVQGTVADLPASTVCQAVVSINVLEHIQDDQPELARYASLLWERRGVLCLFVPARQEIYAPLDRDFGHYRRYSRPGLRRKLTAAGFQVVRLNYFNCVGYFGWWFTFCVLRRRCFNERSITLFDRVVFPVSYALESKVCRPPFGQSLLAVARAAPR